MDTFSDIMYELEQDGVLGILMIVFLIIFAICLAALIFRIVYTWKIFKKAGKSGWEALVPYYNKWVLTEISEVNWWWFLLLVIAPFISLTYNISSTASDDAGFLLVLFPLSMVMSVAEIMANLVISTNLAKKFDKGIGYGILIALIPIIGMPLIAFSKDKYNFDLEVPSNGILGGDPLRKSNSVKTTSAETSSKNECQNCHNKINNSIKYCPNCGNKLR